MQFVHVTDPELLSGQLMVRLNTQHSTCNSCTGNTGMKAYIKDKSQMPHVTMNHIVQ